MENSRARKGANKIVTICAGVRRGESVVVVADDKTLLVADLLDLAAREVGADPVICRMQTRRQHGQEPPPPVAAALAAADVFFTPVSVSITHTRAIKEAIARGTRGLVMTNVTPAMLEGGGIDADFQKQAVVCRRLAAIFQSGKLAHLTTPGGTDLRMSLEGRRGNALTGIVKPGEFSTFPTIEANFSPVEGSAHGVLVADASIPYLGIGVLQEPVRAKVAAGYITDIRGGREASVLKADLASRNDPEACNIAELGIGLNPSSQLCGLMLEDEGVLGVVHIGIGSNLTLGGVVKADTHYDLLMYRADLDIDSEPVLRNGSIV